MGGVARGELSKRSGFFISYKYLHAYALMMAINSPEQRELDVNTR